MLTSLGNHPIAESLCEGGARNQASLKDHRELSEHGNHGLTKRNAMIMLSAARLIQLRAYREFPPKLIRATCKSTNVHITNTDKQLSRNEYGSSRIGLILRSILRNETAFDSPYLLQTTYQIDLSRHHSTTRFDLNRTCSESCLSQPDETYFTN